MRASKNIKGGKEGEMKKNRKKKGREKKSEKKKKKKEKRKGSPVERVEAVTGARGSKVCMS
jgi:hypothetical protein